MPQLEFTWSGERVQVLKPITYRGGLVQFEIPSHWAEEYEPDGGGAFYDPGVDALTLRLNVITARPPGSLRLDGAAEALQTLAGPGDAVERLPSGQALLIGPPSIHEERGERLEIHAWRLARAVSPGVLRIAVFATTVLARASKDATIHATLALLLDRVRAAAISDWAGPE